VFSRLGSFAARRGGLAPAVTAVAIGASLVLGTSVIKPARRLRLR
jgi:hypothetical protein